MRQELDELLCKKYPKIFKNRNADMKDTAMCWGFEISDGWFHIIDKACGDIQSHINSERKQRASALRAKRSGKEISPWSLKYLENSPCSQVVAVQVKEKFGTLRFYVNGGDEFTSGVIAMAESMTEITCETCGSPEGKLIGGGWLHTQCESCQAHALLTAT